MSIVFSPYTYPPDNLILISNPNTPFEQRNPRPCGFLCFSSESRIFDFVKSGDLFVKCVTCLFLVEKEREKRKRNSEHFTKSGTAFSYAEFIDFLYQIFDKCMCVCIICYIVRFVTDDLFQKHRIQFRRCGIGDKRMTALVRFMIHSQFFAQRVEVICSKISFTDSLRLEK